MPKIIENLRERLLLEAKRQIAEYGYAGTTVKSVAKACSVGVGTVYNYFPSKEMLVAGFMAEEWLKTLDIMKALPKDEPRTLLYGIYDALSSFAQDNKALFSDSDAAKVAGASFSVRHKMLRSQIAELILPVCKNTDINDTAFLSEFAAESLICWAMEKKDFDAVYSILKNIIKK